MEIVSRVVDSYLFYLLCCSIVGIYGCILSIYVRGKQYLPIVRVNERASPQTHCMPCATTMDSFSMYLTSQRYGL